MVGLRNSQDTVFMLREPRVKVINGAVWQLDGSAEEKQIIAISREMRHQIITSIH